jgi:transcriptional regulator with PAS, ATPase and Fis domain
MNFDWQKVFTGAITVCDENYIITYMNDSSKETFKEDGGESLIGKNLLDCHGEDSRKKLIEISKGKNPNVYTIEKAGIKKLIYQCPVYDGEKFRGLVELSLQIPFNPEHFKRD